MSRRPPRDARFLGLWTAGWLAVLLVAGLLLAGDLTLQWPVLAVPLLWALIALRPRRRRWAERDDDAGFWTADRDGEPPDDGPAGDERQADEWSVPERRVEPPIRDWQPPPPTRETQVLPPLPPRGDEPRRY